MVPNLFVSLAVCSRKSIYGMLCSTNILKNLKDQPWCKINAFFDVKTGTRVKFWINYKDVSNNANKNLHINYTCTKN